MILRFLFRSDETERQKGYSTALLNDMLKFLKENIRGKNITHAILQADLIAVSLYSRLGFQSVFVYEEYNIGM